MTWAAISSLIKRVVEPGMIPEIDLPSSPIGFGVTASEEEVCIHGAVTVKTIKQLVQTITKAMAPGLPEQEPGVEIPAEVPEPVPES